MDLHAERFAQRLDSVADNVTEVRLNIMPDNEDDLVESRFDRVMDRIINNDLTLRADRRELLHAAAVSGTDSRSEDQKRLFHDDDRLH